MLIEHEGSRPRVDGSAWIAPTAVVSGAVTVEPNVWIQHGAVVTAELGGEVAVGEGCVIMEQAVSSMVRSAARRAWWPSTERSTSIPSFTEKAACRWAT